MGMCREMNSDAATVWQWVALSDEQLEAADLVAINLAVARGVPGLRHLDVGRYCRTVDEWTLRFARQPYGVHGSLLLWAILLLAQIACCVAAVNAAADAEPFLRIGTIDGSPSVGPSPLAPDGT